MKTHFQYTLLLLFFQIQINAQDIKWTDSLSGMEVYFHVDENSFKEHKHRTSREFEIIETDAKYHQAAIEAIKTAIRKYPPYLIKQELPKVYIYDQFRKGNMVSGEYLGRHGLFIAMPYTKINEVDRLDLERLFHHEFSHRLHMWHFKKFDYMSWKEINQLKYGTRIVNDLTLLKYDPTLYHQGFLHKYAVSNKYEDFTSFAEQIFIYKAEFWNTVVLNDLLTRKLHMVFDFYHALDPLFTMDYFLNLHKGQIDENTIKQIRSSKP